MADKNDREIDETEEFKRDSIENQLGKAADEFSVQLAEGKNPSVEEFARRFPEIAETIRQVFPVLRKMPVLGMLGEQKAA